MILVDTNVWSEPWKPAPNANVLAFFLRHGSQLLLSSLVLSELRYGVEAMPVGRRRSDLDRLITALQTVYAGNVVDFDERAAVEYGRLAANVRQRTGVVPLIDTQIAAQALSRGLTIATRNTDHFQHNGLTLIDPWSD